jgi:hypothetical protein
MSIGDTARKSPGESGERKVVVSTREMRRADCRTIKPHAQQAEGGPIGNRQGMQLKAELGDGPLSESGDWAFRVVLRYECNDGFGKSFRRVVRCSVFCSSSSRVRGQSERKSRDRLRSASSFPPVWQRAQ